MAHHKHPPADRRATRLGKELVKRLELQEEIAREARRPLGDQRLSPTERQAIAERVRGGRMRQAMWPGAGGGGRRSGLA